MMEDGVRLKVKKRQVTCPEYDELISVRNCWGCVSCLNVVSGKFTEKFVICGHKS